MSTLSERAMLATLHIGTWAATQHDREVTDEVAENHRADAKDAGRYSKQIVARKFLRHVGSKLSAARTVHRTLTSPWEDDGTRILSSTGYTQYTEQMRLCRLAVETAAREFADNLPEYITEAEVRLGTMFDRNDYPTADEVRRKFYIDVEIKKVPEAGDFRVRMSDATVKAIIKDIERRNDERLDAAMKDVYQRVADATGKMVERLRAYKPVVAEGEKRTIIQDVIVWNVKEIADLIPVLNITGDPKLDQLQQQLLDELVEHSPEILRTNDKVRKNTADKAEKILAKVKKYLA